jgi:hypothetical protein
MSNEKKVRGKKRSIWEILEIKDLLAHGYPNYKIQQRYNLSRSMVSKLKHEHRWPPARIAAEIKNELMKEAGIPKDLQRLVGFDNLIKIGQLSIEELSGQTAKQFGIHNRTLLKVLKNKHLIYRLVRICED